MLGATVIAVFFIPMFFYVLETMSEKSSGGKKTPGAERRRRHAQDATPPAHRVRRPEGHAVRPTRGRLTCARSRSASLPASLAALLALGGCLLGPNYERPRGRNAGDVPLRRQPKSKEIANTAWWEQFRTRR